MPIEKLTLKNFRNIKDLTLELSPHINLIIAPNGTGKTNVLESIALVSRGKSPRTNFDADLLPIESDESDENAFSKIEAQIKEVNDPKEMILVGTPAGGAKKTYKVKGKNTTKRRFAEELNSVYFSPESIGYLTQGFQKKRDLFDSLIESESLDYSDILSEYKKALRNRNIILKKLQKAGSKEELIYWTKVIINNGSKLIMARWKTLADYSSLLTDVSKLIFDDKWVSLGYEPHVDSTPLDSEDEIREEFLNEIKRVNPSEIAAGKTLKGPHRDRWFLNLDERDLSRYGSRGQQRLGIFALFLAFHEKLKSTEVEPPMLLLDDITSELDKKHIELLKDTLVKSESQIFLTSTQEEVVNLLSDLDQKINLIRLEELL